MDGLGYIFTCRHQERDRGKKKTKKKRKRGREGRREESREKRRKEDILTYVSLPTIKHFLFPVFCNKFLLLFV